MSKSIKPGSETVASSAPEFEASEHPKGGDRRVRKTKKHLRDALVSLVLDRGWDAVSVKDVCDRADIGRSTFYAHFTDKEDLLLSGFDDLHQALTMSPSPPEHPFAFAEPLIAHARENVRLYRALIGRRSGQAVQRRFRDTVGKVVAMELTALGVPPDELPAASQFMAGGFAEMLLKWLDHPSRTSPEALASSFRALAVGATRHMTRSA